MAIEKTELTDHLAYGIDLKNRRIYFGINLDTGDVDESTKFNSTSIEYTVRALHRMATDAPNRPIEIHMCSYGGDPYTMLRLYDEIHACPCQVKFFGGGTINSSATWIMVGCDERYLHPHTTVMVHDGWGGYDGNHTDHQIYAAEDKRLQSLLYDIYAENSRMPKAFWEDVCQRDLYLTATEAITLGLADKLIEPKKRGNLRKARYAALKKEPDTKDMNKLLKDIYHRINRVKVPKIELNEVKKEAVDPTLVVDNSPTQIEKPAVMPLAQVNSGEEKT
jgi:ATP-dependent Clp protease protease subunit